jgi:hypothetical protein
MSTRLRDQVAAGRPLVALQEASFTEIDSKSAATATGSAEEPVRER